MKKQVLAAFVLAAASIIFSCKKNEVNPTTEATVVASSSDAKGTKGTTTGGTTTGGTTTGGTTTGNGAPSGSHYQVNIIGVPKGKAADITTGSRIFVPLEGSAKILLSQGEFGVVDANGTDGTASFRLPSPDPDNDGVTNYSVFARPLGTPGGTSKTTTCATNPLTGLVVCSNASYVAVRNSGKTSFTNVSNQLLYIYADLNEDGVVERYPLFDERLQDYFWQYDNNGLKVLQVRFYEISTNVN